VISWNAIGCWLGISQPFKPDGITPNNVLPVFVPPKQDGRFDPNGPDPLFRPVPIAQAIQRVLHRCPIAEVAFDHTLIPVGKHISNWEKPAQRKTGGATLKPGPQVSRIASCVTSVVQVTAGHIGLFTCSDFLELARSHWDVAAEAHSPDSIELDAYLRNAEPGFQCRKTMEPI
jgi:hypothetical protein